jgi:hypothetical protein
MTTMRKSAGAGKTVRPAEDQASILREYRDHYRPVGPLEECLVERLASYGWRLTRAIATESVVETGSIAASRHRPSNSRPLALARAFEHYRRLLESLQSARSAKARRLAAPIKLTYPGNTMIN